MTIFLRLLQSDDKAAALAAAVDGLRAGQPQAGAVFEVAPESFEQVPGSPSAYWVSEFLRGLFRSIRKFEGSGRTVKQGLATADDFRFLRVTWEIPESIVTSGTSATTLAEFHQQTFEGKRWTPFAKGGIYSPFYSDLHLVVNWGQDGIEIKSNLGPTGNIRSNVWMLKDSERTIFFRPGLTWPLRARRFAPQALPAGAICSVRGYGVFAAVNELPALLALGNSQAFDYLFKVLLGRFEFPEFIVGILQQLPVPARLSEYADQLSQYALCSIHIKRVLGTINDTSHVFTLPALLQVEGDTLTQRADVWQARVDDANRRLAEHQREIDDIAFRLYSIEGEDRRAIEESLAGGSRAIGEEGEAAQEAADEGEEGEGEVEVGADAQRLAADLLSWAVGCAFGRWDVRLATSERPIPELPDPFAPLPVCSPGMLTGDDGLPLREPPAGYPLNIDRDGILTDDPDHADDIVRRVGDVLDLLWGERAGAIEREACNILGIKELRDYFRDPRRFWDDHIKRYSKSRRKAPIYWLLQSPKRHYAMWLYYHRLDSDILFKALVNYLEPKIRLEESHLDALKAQRQEAGTAGKEARQIEKGIERQEGVLADLREFRDRLERTAKQYIKPDLNDGVVLNIAPAWEIVPWKEAKLYWEELLKGKYEWSSVGKQLREKRMV